MPSVHTFRKWWLDAKKEVAQASGEPESGYFWISKVEMVEGPEDIQDSDSRTLLDSKLAAGLAKILHGDLARQIQLLEEKG